MKSDQKIAKVHPLSYWSVEDQDVVIVPSLTFDRAEIEKVAGHVHYEERQLFNLLLLKNPKVRLFYITSVPIGTAIIEYYLSLLDLSLNDVKDRLFFFSTHDASPIPLTQKILNRPRFIARIKKSIRVDKAMLLCFRTTSIECDLAHQLGVSSFGSASGSDHWGSKSGSREVFEEAQIPHARGIGLTNSVDEMVNNIVAMCSDDSSIKKMMVKLDQGFSGHGNAVLTLDRSVAPSKEWVLKALANMQFQCPHETWDCFSKKIATLGAIAEEFFEGESPQSPSIQGCVSSDGHVEILSTHEQILNGQVYLGCNFPASESYRSILHDYGRKIGRVLASKGVMGHYGVDFLVQGDCNKSDDVKIYAIEINLRQCGTTHPFFTMKLLTGGTYDKKTGLFLGSNNKHKYYCASDNLHKDQYKGLIPEDIIDLCKENSELRYDKVAEKGPVFHLLGALSEHGKIGLTCIADSSEEAMQIMKRVESIFDAVSPPSTPTPSNRSHQEQQHQTNNALSSVVEDKQLLEKLQDTASIRQMNEPQIAQALQS
eukprot:TRINITY_DN940_c0_g1_i1.p1 TRINITY_DN940_c0_g1~~TRINITY_DN940_c0_g1_i1.p1  ORF type:complete len:541 (+),score=93.80 TRINITY_DN940_c0_g1_i1:101-1723(+)